MDAWRAGHLESSRLDASPKVDVDDDDDDDDDDI